MSFEDRPVFLHSMWRTGSSYLLSRFAANPHYATFYEPFNGEIGSRRLRQANRTLSEQKRAALRHPDVPGGYFEMFEASDPLSGQPLWTLAKPRLPLYDVYNRLSPDGTALLEACSRVASAQQRIPVFGFCHSGIQIAAMRKHFGGQHVYLSRDPRQQFLSYAPQANDFFVAATAIQLLSSKEWRGAAIALVPHLARYPARAMRWIAKRVPHRLTMKLARQIWQQLDIDDMYQLFYLSWLVSNRAGQASCDYLLSLQRLAIDQSERARHEALFAVELAGLREDRSDANTLGIDFASLETRVCRLVGPKPENHVSVPARTAA